MKYLITGGFGFIGSRLTEVLLEAGHDVHVVDNLSTSPIDVPIYIEYLSGPGTLTHDIMDLDEYCNTTARVELDGIFHLASVVGPVGILPYAGRIAGMLVNDTDAVVALAERCEAKVVDVSTSEVYGGGRDGYCTENDMKFIQPEVTVRLEYAVGKLAAETALANSAQIGRIEASIVRPFNVTGPRQSPKGGFVLPRFIGQAIKGEPITVYHDGTMIRAFTHVNDICDGIILTMERGENGAAYNIGNPANRTTILKLAERVVELTESESVIEFVNPKELFGPLFAEANDKYPDATLAFETLGWEPKYGIDDVISTSHEYILSGRSS